MPDFSIAQRYAGTSQSFPRPTTRPFRPPTMPQPSGFRPVSPPARFNINEAFQGVTGAGANVLAEAGRLPARVLESPLSTVDVLATRAFGFDRSPLTTLSQQRLGPGGPSLGEIGGALNEGVTAVGNWVPSMVNERDARIWSIVAGLPDDTEITPEVLARAGLGGEAETTGEDTPFFLAELGNLVWSLIGAGPGGSLAKEAVQAHGFAGPFQRFKTVGEFREELATRGFFYSDEGELLNPMDVAAQIRTGRRQPGSFGMAAINDDPLVDAVGRIGLDPSNLLLLTGVGTGIKAANIAMKIPGLVRAGGTTLNALHRLQEAGTLVRTARSTSEVVPAVGRISQAARTGQAINQSDLAQVTIRGLARAMQAGRAYRKLSIGTYGANIAANQLSQVVTNLADDQELPIFSDIEEFTDAVLNRQPLSNNAALMLAAAVSFPYRAYWRQAKEATGSVTSRFVGYGDLDPFTREAGGKAALVRRAGGLDYVQSMVDHIDTLLAFENGYLDIPGLQSAIVDNAPAAASIVRESRGAVRHAVDELRKVEGRALPEMRYQRFQRWFEESGGFVLRDERGKPLPGGLRGSQAWDLDLALRQWREYYDTAYGTLSPVLTELGYTIGRMRGNEVLLRGRAQAAYDFAKENRVRETRNGKAVDVVPLAAVREIIARFPELNEFEVGTKTNYWARFSEGGDLTAPTWASVRAKIAAQRRRAIREEDYYADVAEFERQAPDDLAGELVDHRYLRDTAREIDDIREILDDPTRPVEEKAVMQERHDALVAERRTRQAERDARTARNEGFDPAVKEQMLMRAERWIKDNLDPSGEVASDAVHLGQLDASIKSIDPYERILLTTLERDLLGNTPYRMKNIPLRELTTALPEGTSAPVRWRNALGDWLYADALPDGAGHGLRFMARLATPVGKAARGIQAVTRPVLSEELAHGLRATTQVMFQRIGFKPDEVDHIMQRLFEEVGRLPKKEDALPDAKPTLKHTATTPSGGPFTGVHLALFREPGALFPGTVNGIIGEVIAQMPPKRAQKVSTALRQAGGGYRTFSKATSGFYRRLHRRKLADDAAGRTNTKNQRMFDLYTTSVDGKVWGTMSDGMRLLGRFVYPLMRFTLDPRWVFLNAIEGSMLGASKYGTLARYAAEQDVSLAGQSLVHQLASDPVKAAALATEQGAMTMHGSAMNLRAAAASDHASRARAAEFLEEAERQGDRVRAVQAAKEAGQVVEREVTTFLDEWGWSDRSITAIRSGLSREARFMREEAEAGRANGSLTPSEYRAALERADAQENLSGRGLAELLMDEQYRVSQEGVGQVFGDEARRLLTPDEMKAAAPLLVKLQSLYKQTHDEVRGLFYGNPRRSYLERTLNSYWVFWPISYQIKAIKWLTDIMLGGAFGHDRNALLAGVFANWEEQHHERLANNPALQVLYEQNPMIWQAAQMLFPMTPDSMGVSMNRIVRSLGDTAAAELLGNEDNPFGAVNLVDDPGRALRYWVTMGPLFTLDFIDRLSNDLERSRNPEFAPISRADLRRLASPTSFRGPSTALPEPPPTIDLP